MGHWGTRKNRLAPPLFKDKRGEKMEFDLGVQTGGRAYTWDLLLKSGQLRQQGDRRWKKEEGVRNGGGRGAKTTTIAYLPNWQEGLKHKRRRKFEEEEEKGKGEAGGSFAENWSKRTPKSSVSQRRMSHHTNEEWWVRGTTRQPGVPLTRARRNLTQKKLVPQQNSKGKGEIS